MKNIIQTATNDIQQSIDFYEKLNFTTLYKDQSEYVSDGTVIIEINPDRFARSGLKIFDSQYEKMANELEKITPVISIDNGYLAADPSGVWIYLMDEKEDLNMDLSDVSTSVLGNSMGLSLETISIPKSMEFWQKLGFSKTMGEEEQGWIAMKNGAGFGISIMKPNSCPHLFFNPSLTYFNGVNNPGIIEKIRTLQIPITEEITHFNSEGIVDNIIIRDPGGLGFFLFND